MKGLRYRFRDTSGHTLVETMVVLAIIGVLVATAVPHYVRGIRTAKRTAVMEAKRQQNLVKYAGGERSRRPIQNASAEVLRNQARRAYRYAIDAGKFDFYVTEVIYKVASDAEFRAYWHTLIDIGATAPVQITESGYLVARDPEGNSFELAPASVGILPGDDRPTAMGWDFIATQLRHSAIGDLGGSVLMSDGTSRYVRYPGDFPMSRTVAELSQRFMDEVFPALP